MSTGLAAAYASAIHTLAVAEGSLDVVEAELGSIARAIGSDAGLHRQLSDRQVPAEQRMRFLDAGVLASTHPATRGAIALLITAERIGELGAVATALAELVAADQGMQHAEVRVASALTEAQTTALQAALERKLGTSLSLRLIVDPAVLGGVWARVGDTVIDGTVARRLAEIRTRIGN
jgi:F-type H+-transporting ATPase subunit delta